MLTNSKTPHFSVRTDEKYWQCERKRPYSSVKYARNAAGLASKKASMPVVPYKCPHCGSWHIGKSMKRKEND